MTLEKERKRERGVEKEGKKKKFDEYGFVIQGNGGGSRGLTNTFERTQIHALTHTLTHSHRYMRSHTLKYIHSLTHTQTCTHTDTYILTHTHVLTHTHIYALTHT